MSWYVIPYKEGYKNVAGIFLSGFTVKLLLRLMIFAQVFWIRDSKGKIVCP
jgi:hypothetical protein